MARESKNATIPKIELLVKALRRSFYLESLARNLKDRNTDDLR